VTTPRPVPKRKRAKLARENLQPGVYVIQAGDDGPCKIGVSANPERRLAQLQTGNSARLVLVALYLCQTWLIAKTLEASVHVALAPFRLMGEWFRVTPETACREIEKQATNLGYGSEARRDPTRDRQSRRQVRSKAA
jgi:predicted GIY-YIG superfamily endonuclease